MTVEVLLAALLLITNTLWAINTHRLINKIMSRSFYEYKEALDFKKEEPKKKDPGPFEDLGALDEIMS
jgi:hypothetical protein